jgi:hypothetical protein
VHGQARRGTPDLPARPQADGGGGRTAASVDLSADTSRTSSGHPFDTTMCCHDVMTTCAALLPRREDATVVEVHGSRFLLEWLDLGTLASAAALDQRCADLPLPEDPAA